MKPSQFFTLVAMIYLVPHLSARVGVTMGVVFLILAGLMLISNQ